MRGLQVPQLHWLPVEAHDLALWARTEKHMLAKGDVRARHFA
eukprot:CAMPEP_0180682272 /NCGR_PEP_ID=MMETSP1037_2-20121125/70464_1 /TAXON_ID=632150 /ORGANISM="Azadinium spinosum, Strain 3D9" /LENGTH=41 /DNA_ID= /DNA_START= /DNA_END= /DNA_ORIENTATION=